jgi:putative oxidoreductase
VDNVAVEHVNLGLLVLRVGVGLTVFLHGWNKVFGGGKLAGTAQWFESMGMKPGWLHARMAAGTELGAGLLLALGLLTPLAAAGIIALMVVAGITAHRKNGFFIFRPGQGWEYVMVLAIAAFAVAAIGAGEWSIDHALDLDVESWWGAAVALIGGVGGGLLFLAIFWRPPREPAT